MRKIKVAQIGIAHDHSEMTFNSIMKQSDVFDVAGYFVPEEDKSHWEVKGHTFKKSKALTLEEILENPEIEAVIIETDEKVLTKYSILAAQHKKHIHMDKPGGMELADFEKLIDIVRKNGLEFHTGYMYRYNPEVMKLKESIKKGEIGDVFAVEAQMSCIYPTTTQKRQWLERFKGGMMFFLGCHLVDLIVDIMGEPERIVPFNKSTGVDGTTSEDFGMAVFEYKNGTSFAKTCASEIGGGARRQLVVSGTKKTVEIKPIEVYDEGSLSAMCADVAYYQSESRWEPAQRERSAGFDRYDNMMKAFAEYVAGEKKNPWSIDYELMLYKCVLKACGYNI